MKQLTCEMCGSTDLLKQNGVFVCQTCGTKYSVEEAKKMMNESAVNISGTVNINNANKIKNYLEMAKSAYEAGNKSEAEAYCNRIIEVEPQNHEAWFMKGEAAGWQSTIANIRIEESVQCFSKAVDYAPENKTEDVKARAAEEVSNLSTALVSLACDNFRKYQSEDNANTIIDCALKAKKYALVLLNKCGIKPDEYEKSVATLINNAVVNAWNIIRSEYANDNDGRPSHYAFSNLIEKAGFCSILIKTAIDFADNDELSDAARYENLIAINEYCIDACSWKQEYGYENTSQALRGGWNSGLGMDDGQHWFWVKEYTLTASAISSRRDENAKFRDKAKSCREKGQRRQREENERKAQEQKEKNETYWTEHAVEKQQLESELNRLQTELKELEPRLAPFETKINILRNNREEEVPAEKEKNDMLSEISRFRQEQGKLGLFKSKEKKALQAQIDELYSRLPSLNIIEQEKETRKKEINAEIAKIEEELKPFNDKKLQLQKRIDEINQELTKPR